MLREALAGTIETERLQLRSWALEDADALYEIAKDPRWGQYLQRVPAPYTRADADRYVAGQLLRDRTSHASWAIIFEGRVVGGVSLRFDFNHRLAETGYSMHPELWGKGLTPEAVSAVIDLAFSSYPDLNRIHARADRRNAASHRVMEKVGMQKEGVMRMSRVVRGEAIDEVWCAILRREWESRPGGTARTSIS